MNMRKRKLLFLACVLSLAIWGDCSSEGVDEETAPPPATDEVEAPDENTTAQEEQAIPPPDPAIANGAWADVLKKENHPRLYGSKEYIKARFAEDAYLYKIIKGNALATPVKNTMGVVYDAVVAGGIARASDGTSDAAKAQEIRTIVMGLVNKGVIDTHYYTYLNIRYVAAAYDFFYDIFSAAERAKIITWFNGHLKGGFKNDEQAFTVNLPYKIAALLMAAYATWEDNPQAKALRDWAIKDLYDGRLVPAFVRLGDGGGGQGEGGWYFRNGIQELFYALELARRFEGYDGFQKAPKFYYQRMAYELLQAYPGIDSLGWKVYAMEGDGLDNHNVYPFGVQLYLASYWRGSELARYTMASLPSQEKMTAMSLYLDFTLLMTGYNNSEEKIEPSTFPLAHLSSGIGKVFARGAWTDDATWLRLECGNFYTNHDHYHAGSFEIYRNAPLATESGFYGSHFDSNHCVNWLIRTIAHNSILIDMPAEPLPTAMRDGPIVNNKKYYNDGGQYPKWNTVAMTMDEWDNKREAYHFDGGTITAYENDSAYMFAACDVTKAYYQPKLDKWIRQIVFLRPSTFVIFDRVVTPDPSYLKTWLVHSVNEPAISQSTTTTTLKNGTGHLYIRTLLPEKGKVKISKTFGYTYDGVTFNPPDDADWKDLSYQWRVEVLPTDTQKEHVFLHVLSTDELLQPALISDKGKIGALIGTTEVVFEGDTGGKVKIGDTEYPLTAEIKKGKYE